jgi:glycosyltransferase involved in cell wall biosynthesis
MLLPYSGVRDESIVARKPKVALLVNMISPCRIALYETLAELVDLVILHGDLEANRHSWRERRVRGASSKRIVGWQYGFDRYERGRVSDQGYLHIEPGYILELIRERPDVIITDEMGFRTVAALAYGSLFGRPVVVWWGGTPHTEQQLSPVRKLLRAWVARWAKRWISYGQSSTDYLLSLGIPHERILQSQNGVNEAWFDISREPKLEFPQRPVLLHVGRLVARKGVEEFFRAAAELQNEGLDFSIVTVGGGPESERLRALAKALALNNLYSYPSQPPEAMAHFYQQADALIFPTMSDVWGLVANEAVLCGLPVLCSRYAGCAQELFDTSCIFDPARHSDFVRALRKAVLGQVPRTDVGRLMTSTQAGHAIAQAVLEVIQANRRSRRGVIPRAAQHP